ncbi:tetratricopeptide repeat protein [Acidicapsa dinghuensis]|uniref:Tetratricopeptide repeat protein n=1 Tax=Acidicapsa dinghuensis TaxID=2218256 RepID=A0ABW1EC31_9BACT|nr:tetratricopeptide repeat protein [Acidicapsa dinghuensis]
MLFRKDSRFVPFALTLVLLIAAPLIPAKTALAQASSSSSSSSSPRPTFAQEKAPSLVDPAGPAIELIPSEQLFFMAAALNQCGYDDGLADSDPMRQNVRDQIQKVLATSEDARKKRDAVCLYIAQHRMTGTVKDISQYVSLALYLTPPPALETSVELPEMPPDSTQVVEILPLLRDFATAVDLHGIWLTLHHSYDEYVNQLHDALTKMILTTNYYLKTPVSTYDGRRFVVVVEPQLNPGTVNARIYGTDYVVVVSPAHNQIRMLDVRHTYLHYLIEPLLYQRADAMERYLPILKEVREAPLDYRYRSDIVDLTIECLIKAIEARTMDTGIKPYVTPTDERRQDFARIETERNAVAAKMETVRQAQVRHDMNQGWVLTAYFYEQLLHFERDPASIKDSIGEIVYSMDVDHEVHRARDITFDQQADDDVLRRSKPRVLTGLDLAEAKLSTGDPATAASLARQALAANDASVDTGRANFILARTAIMGGDPDSAMTDFQKAADTAKETRIRAWSHIYLGRMMDLACKRNDAVAQYNQALAVRDGQQDTRLAAEHGLKKAYEAQQGHTCSADDSNDDGSGAAKDGSDPAAGSVKAPAPGDSSAASSGTAAPK